MVVLRISRMYIFNHRVSSLVSACVQNFSCVEDNYEYNIVDHWLIHTIPNDNFSYLLYWCHNYLTSLLVLYNLLAKVQELRFLEPTYYASIKWIIERIIYNANIIYKKYIKYNYSNIHTRMEDCGKLSVYSNRTVIA